MSAACLLCEVKHVYFVFLLVSKHAQAKEALSAVEQILAKLGHQLFQPAGTVTGHKCLCFS